MARRRRGERDAGLRQGLRRDKNWLTGITLLVADAHLRYATGLDPAERAKYLRSPEVWDDIRSVYDEYLKHYPRDDVRRSKYAALCYDGRPFPEAHAQFQALGDRLPAWTGFPALTPEGLKAMRDEVARVAGSRAGRARPGPARAGST